MTIETDVRETIAEGLKKFVGEPMTPETMFAMQAVIHATLDDMKGQGVIPPQANLEVTIDENDPTIIHVRSKEFAWMTG